MDSHHFIQLGVGIFTAGVAWGAVRMGLNGVEKRLSDHISNTNTWRAEVMARLDALTQSLLK
jgi:hypothetical protein